MSEPDSVIIKKTQNSLGKYVKKPALTDKLLKKPPFRFLHDVINVVIKETNFLKDLYTPEELNSDNVKDREAKVAYLQKLIDVTKAVTGKELKVRPSKVIAGLEPERTNELLQAIGFALDKKLDSTSVVQSYLNGSANGVDSQDTPANVNVARDSQKDDRKSKDKSKEKDKGKDKGKPRDKTKVSSDVKKDEPTEKKEKTEKITKNKEKEKVGNKVEKQRTPKEDTKKLEKSRSKDKERSLKRSESIKEEPPLTTTKSQLNKTEESSIDNDSKDSLKENQAVAEVSGKKLTAAVEDELVAVIDEEAELRRIERSSSRRSSLKKQGGLTPSENNVLGDLNQFNGLDVQDLNRQINGVMGDILSRHDSDPIEPIASERISAKVPVNRQQSVDSVMRPRTSLRPPSVRPPSARPGAPRRKERNVEIVLQPNETTKLGEINVKMEVFNNELLDDDGENLIVIEDPTQIGAVYGESGTDVERDSKDEQDQGHLVQQILETQKEFSSITGGEVKADVAKKTDLEWTSSQRQSSSKQMETMRDSIQKLTRSVNPLGKLMDFLQEDIDSMERELSNWQQIYSQSAVELNKERSANENAIEPLKHQLAQIEGNIKEYREMIDITRSNILQNETKIERLYMTEI
ncbi:TRAF3-interacting protein 1 [Topomyia yanbarensis]|uniref:TRAF3-interacting protein 1 n=1 Tax=Topomyia yanbarensis TaxID=2498891 RepID=UPI00273B18F2|nr:TRAF3-interacting protein 1 [Topomyia yanbarensis]